jgi:Lrp/AsnC family transcriptional regulator, leucine-responsive regulatory protein
MSLDLKDKKLLYELDINSKQSSSTLAKKIGISKQGCTYKLRKLIENKILIQTIAVINTPLIGHLSFRMYFKLIDILPEKESEFKKWLIGHKLIPWVVGCEGIWDYVIVVFPKDFIEFQQFSTELNNNWGNFIEKKEIALVTKAHHFRAGYILGKKPNIPALIYAGQPSDVYLLNVYEQKILGIICKNAREELVSISKQIGISAKNVSYYIRKLEEKKVIEGYTIRVNYDLLGFERYKVFIRTKAVTEKKEKIFIEWAKQQPFCLYYSKSIGTVDVELELIVKNSNHLREIVSELKIQFGDLIKSYETMRIYEEFKLNFLPWL